MSSVKVYSTIKYYCDIILVYKSMQFGIIIDTGEPTERLSM